MGSRRVGARNVRVTLRPAGAADCALIFEWANDPGTRAASFSPQAIAWDQHRTWFERILADADRMLYVLLTSDEPIGQARLERSGERAVEVSLSLAPAWRGRGLGAEAIRLVTDEAARRGARVAHAFVRPENAASLRAFSKAGYVDRGRVARKGVSAIHLTADLIPRSPLPPPGTRRRRGPR